MFVYSTRTLVLTPVNISLCCSFERMYHNGGNIVWSIVFKSARLHLESWNYQNEQTRDEDFEMLKMINCVSLEEALIK